jgi:mannose-6-phosphate isomerase-like protein (cupin superfamily)
MNRPKGFKVIPHIHNVISRDVHLTQEVLFIKSGSVQMDIFDLNRKFVKTSILHKGDVVLLASGGHGFTMLEKSEIIEVKTGPHIGEKDKSRFD